VASERAMKAYKGECILVVEGVVFTKDNGIYCQIGGKPAINILKKVVKEKYIGKFFCEMPFTL
jgi:Ni,Fe-hydrogenase I small subunit